MWINGQLDKNLFQRVDEIQSEENVDIFRQEFPIMMAEAALKHRDFKTLTKLLSEHESVRRWFENLKPRKRGRPKGRHGERYNMMTYASEHVDRVRQICREHYEGRCNRGPRMPPSATSIVVRRFRDLGFVITEESFEKWRKEHGRVLRV